jgi:hypothetical protein
LAHRGVSNQLALVNYPVLEGGQPFTVALPFDNSNTGRGGDTPDVVSGQKPNDGPKTPTQWFNTAAFRAPAPLTFGSAGRSIVIGPGVNRFDFSVHKDFLLSEARSVKFRMEIFNLFNHPAFFQPGNAFGTPNFGVIGGAFDGRDLQFSLKFKFSPGWSHDQAPPSRTGKHGDVGSRFRGQVQSQLRQQSPGEDARWRRDRGRDSPARCPRQVPSDHGLLALPARSAAALHLF